MNQGQSRPFRRVHEPIKLDNPRWFISIQDLHESSGVAYWADDDEMTEGMPVEMHKGRLSQRRVEAANRDPLKPKTECPTGIAKFTQGVNRFVLLEKSSPDVRQWLGFSRNAAEHEQ